MLKKFLLSSLLLLSACTTQVSRLSIVSPQESRFNADALNHATATRNVETTSTTPIILFIPLGHPNLQTVFDDMLKKGRGNVIVDATVYEKSNWYVLFGYRQIKVIGDVLNIQE